MLPALRQRLWRLPIAAPPSGLRKQWPIVLSASSAGYKTAQELKGMADAQATTIYARAYGKDPDLYEFLKSMETLNASLDEKATLILSTDSELLKYLKATGGR